VAVVLLLLGWWFNESIVSTASSIIPSDSESASTLERRRGFKFNFKLEVGVTASESTGAPDSDFQLGVRGDAESAREPEGAGGPQSAAAQRRAAARRARPGAY